MGNDIEFYYFFGCFCGAMGMLFVFALFHNFWNEE